ncbi:MAG: type III pantothenate kinase [Eubacteriales bacterium]|nr:type III pantothenate kinase [Eubacteriales bacterium]
MILAIDIGNSNIKIGFVTEDRVIEERLSTNSDKTSLQYASDITFAMELHGIDKDLIEGSIVSSVVPSLTAVVATSVNKILGARPVLVDGSLNYSFGLNGLSNRNGIGADLLAASEGAIATCTLPCIMISMGTATTVMLLDKDGEFRGGSILPGLRTSLKALTNGAAVLPDISLDTPGSPLGYDTTQCMRAGIIYGNAAQIDGLVERIEEEIGEKCSVVATGGLARFCIPYCKHEIKRDDGLIMRGLYHLYKKNPKA